MHANLCTQSYTCTHLWRSSFMSALLDSSRRCRIFAKIALFPPIWYGVKVSISTLVRCKDSELVYEHAWTAMKCFWRGKPFFILIAIWEEIHGYNYYEESFTKNVLCILNLSFIQTILPVLSILVTDAY